MRSEYIGREVVGFEFQGDDDSLSYANAMDKYIGQKGTILKKDRTGYCVNFSDTSWWYPFEGIEEQLVEPAVVEPELTLEETLEKIKNL